MTLDGADLVNKNRTEGIKSPTYKKCGNALEIVKNPVLPHGALTTIKIRI